MEEAKKKYFKEESDDKEEAATSDQINPAKDVHKRRTFDGRSPNR